MKKMKGILIVLLAVMVTGCSNRNSKQQEANGIAIEQQTEKDDQGIQSTDRAEEKEAPAVTEHIVDYSEYFQGINGCAVIYDKAANTYFLYNQEKCETEVSPLSTFKIISALAGLENNVLVNEASTMEYSGANYPVDTWNADLTLEEAFAASCIWYFRQVVDMVGQEAIGTMLQEIQYGNCDISQWNGSEMNSLPELNGFWLESSLKISPKQQVEALNYIFDGENNFSVENLEKLKNIMYAAELEHGRLYGKTGSGNNGNAWFVGFLEESDNRSYFAVYLDDMQNKDIVSGNKAKEIAVSILSKEADSDEYIKKIGERSQYYMASAYYSEITDYWENVREVRDISNVTEPLFDTDKKYYTREEFEGEPMLVIHLAKNEIYARHGYIFKNEDLQNYFMGCIWYDPICDAAGFDDSIFNEYEKANLKILADLDTY